MKKKQIKNNMDNFFRGIGVGVAAILVLGLVAFFAGTIVYWIWPIAVPAAFPGLVTAGTIAAKLTWWQSVCLSWLFMILVKGSTSTNNNKS